jgi:hypothetical protein
MNDQSISNRVVSARNLAFPLMIFLGLVSDATAQQPAPLGDSGVRTATSATTSGGQASRSVMQASHAPEAPTIDGSDAEPAWANATAITDFRMFQPVEDADPHFRTEAKVVYDAANFYVFVRAHDPRPDSIIGLLSRRDVKTQSDQIKVMIDSYHDRQTGYEFAVNPVGVKRDYYTYDDSREDASWDAVWDVATRIDSSLPSSPIEYVRLHDHARRRAHERADELAALPVHETRNCFSVWRGHGHPRTDLSAAPRSRSLRSVEERQCSEARNLRTLTAAVAGNGREVRSGIESHPERNGESRLRAGRS